MRSGSGALGTNGNVAVEPSTSSASGLPLAPGIVGALLGVGAPMRIAVIAPDEAGFGSAGASAGGA